ncbi:hypothetical protein MRX96_009881 [Rhipicephalus microplus]
MAATAVFSPPYNVHRVPNANRFARRGAACGAYSVHNGRRLPFPGSNLNMTNRANYPSRRFTPGGPHPHSERGQRRLTSCWEDPRTLPPHQGVAAPTAATSQQESRRKKKKASGGRQRVRDMAHICVPDMRLASGQCTFMDARAEAAHVAQCCGNGAGSPRTPPFWNHRPERGQCWSSTGSSSFSACLSIAGRLFFLVFELFIGYWS